MILYLIFLQFAIKNLKKIIKLKMVQNFTYINTRTVAFIFKIVSYYFVNNSDQFLGFLLAAKYTPPKFVQLYVFFKSCCSVISSEPVIN